MHYIARPDHRVTRTNAYALRSLIRVRIRIPIGIGISAANTRCVGIAVVVSDHTGVRRNSVAVCVLRNVRIRLDNTLTLIRVGVAGVGIVGIVRIGAISVFGSAAARKGYAGNQH